MKVPPRVKEKKLEEIVKPLKSDKGVYRIDNASKAFRIAFYFAFFSVVIALVLLATDVHGDAPTPKAAPSVAASTPAPYELYTKPGDRGPKVVEVQQRLRSFGYTIAADGIYGPITEKAVKHFQHANKLFPNGIINVQTKSALGILWANRPAAPAVSHIHKAHWSPDTERWYKLAMKVGWKESQWPILSCIIHRESHGLPYVVNKHSDATGLLQILAHFYPKNNLKDPEQNLRAGLQLYKLMWWQPWTLPGHQCY